MTISPGSRVTLHFAIRLTDGMTVESSFDDEPLSFAIGDGTLDEGLELALYGLTAGTRQTLTLVPGQAFGRRDPSAVRQVARSAFPADMALEKGQIIGFGGPGEQEAAGAVLDVGPEQVTVDFNHPLAGREIVFEVHVLAVENPFTDQD